MRVHCPHPPEIRPPSDAASSAEISQVGRLISDAIALPEIRLEKVTEFSRLINAGIYESEDRLLGAFVKFLDEVAGR
jgi:hypothetical protein